MTRALGMTGNKPAVARNMRLPGRIDLLSELLTQDTSVAARLSSDFAT